MALKSLTRIQLATVMALVQAGRLDVVPADQTRATAFLRRADERLSQLILLTSVTVKYDLSYDAAHDVGEALLAAYGYRTANGPGQHEALGRYLQAILNTPPGDKAAKAYNKLRRKRNQNHYQAATVGVADAHYAEPAARALYAAAINRGLAP
jgi:hypothetical protein